MLKSVWELLGTYIPWIACKGSDGDNVNGPSITEGTDVKEQSDAEGQIVLMVVAPWKELQQVKFSCP